MVDEKFEGEESFADLFEQSLKAPRRSVRAGEKVSGTIVQIGSERALVDLGDGIDAMIDLGELAEKGEASTAKVGDRVEAYVAKVENRVAMLARTMGKGPGARAALEDAYRAGIPVEGHVTEVNKGGYVVEVAGSRCFCPLGQMDVRRIEDPATMVGQRLQFLIAEFRGSRDIVVSRRQLLEKEQESARAETRKNLQVGARFHGKVTSVRDFGAFVDIGGMEGLVPASELGYVRSRPQDVVHAGQEVDVEVLRIEPPGPKDRTERITLSMRALAADPWELTLQDLGEGDIVRGTVVRVQPFGAFVEIVPGVDGLLHVSAFGKRVGHPSEMVQPGDSIAVRIEGVDAGNRRISLSYVPPEEIAHLEQPAAEAPAPAPAPAAAAAPAKGETPRETKHEGGMTMRRAQKAEAPAAPAPAPAPAAAPKAASGKPQRLGHSAKGPEAHPVAGAAEFKLPSTRPAAPQVGQVVEATVDKHETFGLFVTFGGGLRGLLPAAELETPKGADLRKLFPAGTKLKAVIIEVRPDGKMRLSAKQATEAEERAEAQEWLKQNRPAAGGNTGAKGFGTFADLLKGKLGK